MTQEQIKKTENIVIQALDKYSIKQEVWNTEIYSITREAFTELRLKDLHEMAAKRTENEINNLNKELWQYQKAIDNLREYIIFLESKISKLQSHLDEHETF